MLKDFLAEVASRPFRFGECDCGIALADWWLRARGGPDPAADIRETYATELGCEAVLKDHGGLGRLVSTIAKRAGAKRTAEPKPGDIAVVEYAGQHWGAIMTPSGRWYIKANERRCGLSSCRVIRAWSVL